MTSSDYRGKYFEFRHTVFDMKAIFSTQH